MPSAQRLAPAVRHLRLLLAAGVVLLQCACTPLAGYVQPGLADAPPAARKALLVGPEIHLFEISAGGVPEKVYAWGDEARKAVRAAVLEENGERRALTLIDPPQLEPDDQADLDRHAAMFRRVADQISAVKEANDSVWKEREKTLEFTLGPGLRRIAQRSGAEAVLFVDGIDFVSSIGRRAVFVLTTLLFGLPVLPPGSAYLQAGLVDMRSGDVLWLGRDYNLSPRDLRQPELARDLVRGVFASYPAQQPARTASR